MDYMKKWLVEKVKGKYQGKPIAILDCEDFKTINKTTLKILKELAKNPSYPNELARKMNMHEQKIYYHINKLKKAGLLEVIKEEKINGALSRSFAPSSTAFGIEINNEEKSELKETEDISKIKDFFHEFIKTGIFNGNIVVGSPTIHGPYLTAARDGHYAIPLAMFIGNYCELPKKFIVKLDTEVKSEKAEKRNMILVGGPVTNILTSSLNDKLAINFKWENKWTISSKLTKKEYEDEDISLIVKIKNPWDETKSIILIAGLKFEGTKASLIALTNHFDKLLKNYKKNKDFYCLVKGLDRDGDGQIDDIEFLEQYTPN
jgi:DNA-binding transcriptional ArsR family regulator